MNYKTISQMFYDKMQNSMQREVFYYKNENKWKEIEFFKSDYIASKDVNAWLGLYEVIK